MSESSNSETQINIKGPNELKLQISISTDKTVLELKQAIAEKSDVEAARQRLIYSGRVLKDEDVLSTYKIQSSHTIHMVKGVARAGGQSTTTTTNPTTPQQLPTMQTGQNIHDPLTQLNSHLGFGAMAGLNPFGDLGLNPNDPNMMQAMLNNPQFVQQMSSLMSNPAVIDQIIASNPQFSAMGPQAREMFQSPQFRDIISNPERLQQMLQMASMFQNASGGAGPLANPFGAATSFPAPGNTNATTPTPNTNAPSQPTDPSRTSMPFDPAMMQQLMGLGMPFNQPNISGLPEDPRPPEVRFQVQLQQLQDMGFSNASQNIRALLATGGNVHSAIEYILGGGGL